MKQYSKILMVLLITAFAVSVGYAQPSTIKRTYSAKNISKVHVNDGFVKDQFNGFDWLDEGVLIMPSYNSLKLYERSFAEVPINTVLLQMRQRYYEKPPLLKSTRQFANFNKTKGFSNCKHLSLIRGKIYLAFS